MSKKFTKGFSNLRTLLKKTETEAEAKAARKGIEFSTRKLPRKPEKPRKPRSLSAQDQFIVDTIAIPLELLPNDQLNEARHTIIDAIDVVRASKESIQEQIDRYIGFGDEQSRDWKARASSALRFKIQEEQQLKQRITLVNDLIARFRPPLKLVEPPPPVEPPEPPKAAAAFEIRTGIPRPKVHAPGKDWRDYPFDKLETYDQSFRFGTETAREVRTLITAAQRELGVYFSYRTEPDGVIAVWRKEGPDSSRKRRKD
jgi:hypothetical protein